MTSAAPYLLAVVLAVGLLPAVWRRLMLSRAKHPSLAGHTRLAKRLAEWMPGYAYDESCFFSCDGAPADVVARRRCRFQALSGELTARSPRTLALTAEARESVPDLEFIGAYRVPFPFSPYLRAHLPVGSFLQAREGRRVQDLDGNWYFDLTGSYGVNLFGYDFYQACIREGVQRAEALGPVLGAYLPCVAQNVEDLKRISGLDAVSFHMSGTEAVMQAVRLARYHTRRSRVVRFCGAYHGWWEDVQPGPGNPLQPRHTLTLKDMDAASLTALRLRRDVACVLVNPLQALHPNRPAPGDGTLVDSSRQSGFDRERYRSWLQELRAVCTARDIVLIFDEVFVGFRLAPGGAQEYFGVRADLVTYGKTIGGGLPVGVICGRTHLMKRFREVRPADICFARGTFNAHPYVMETMRAFLDRFHQESVQQLYRNLDAVWNARADRLNTDLEGAGLPVRVANLSSIWTICYTRTSRYNWMFQFYLRRAGLALSWVGSGRLIFSLDFLETEFDAVAARFLEAARAMHEDGWWWHDATLTNQAIRRRLLREALAHRL